MDGTMWGGPATGPAPHSVVIHLQDVHVAYQGKHRNTGKHPVVRAVAISTALVMVVLAGTVVLTWRHLEGNITESQAFDNIIGERPAEDDVEGPKDPLNILVLGSDSREGQADVLGQTPGLSDTTILLHLSADRSRAYGVSIPRDLMVSRPACKSRNGGTMPPVDAVQWNDAFAVGGEACTVAQFEQMTDILVDHVVIVNFNGFTDMVDALGGVPICVPNDVNDPIGRIYLSAGTYTMDGKQALDYVRVRHSIGSTDTGDIGRMRRQQEFMGSMVNKAVSAGTLFNPVRLGRFLDAATQSLTTDPGLRRLSSLYTLAQEVRGIGLDEVQFLSVPFTTYEPDPNRLALEPSADKLWDQLREDQALGKRFTSKATKASEAKPGDAKSKPKTEEEREEAERVGLCT
jgi:LCP family protein required for cell wall assembly